MFELHKENYPRIITKYEPAHNKTYNKTCATSEDTDHLPSPIRVFAVRMKKAWVLIFPLHAQRRIWVFAGRTCHFVGFVMHWLIFLFNKSCGICGQQKVLPIWLGSLLSLTESLDTKEYIIKYIVPNNIFLNSAHTKKKQKNIYMYFIIEDTHIHFCEKRKKKNSNFWLKNTYQGLCLSYTMVRAHVRCNNARAWACIISCTCAEPWYNWFITFLCM